MRLSNKEIKALVKACDGMSKQGEIKAMANYYYKKKKRDLRNKYKDPQSTKNIIGMGIEQILKTKLKETPHE